MKKVTYIWKNYGLMRVGYDIETIKVDITEETMIITIDTGYFEIKDKLFEFSNEIDCKKILSTLEKINFPKEKEYNADGCDGDAWELHIDKEIYKGYLTQPRFLNEVLDVINFKEIRSYAKTKLKTI